MWKILIYIIISNFLNLLNEFAVTQTIDHIKLLVPFLKYFT
jgi:hypothetical protein